MFPTRGCSETSMSCTWNQNFDNGMCYNCCFEKVTSHLKLWEYFQHELVQKIECCVHESFHNGMYYNSCIEPVTSHFKLWKNFHEEPVQKMECRVQETKTFSMECITIVVMRQ